MFGRWFILSNKVKVLIIDENNNSVITEMDVWLYKRLNIKKEDIKTHRSRNSLNKEVTEFIKNFGNS